MKQLISLLLAGLVLLAAMPAAFAAEASPDEAVAGSEDLVGDIDGDGAISVMDATALQRVLADAVPDGFPRHWDADGDGQLTVSDVTVIQRCCAGAADCGNVGRRSGEVNAPALTALAFAAGSVKLGVGETYPASLLADGATDGAVFSSADGRVASVSADGVIRAAGAGQTTVSCDCGGLRADCRVLVCPAATALSLNATALTLGAGEQYDLDSYVNSGAAAYYRDYYSENPAVATIARAGGLLTGVSAGKTRIYCRLQSGSRVYADVTVSEGIRNRVTGFLREQLGNNNRPYVAYYNAHAGGKKVSVGFAWCAEFAWCALDQCAALLGKKNPVTPCCHVSEIANQARKKGALKNAFSSGYVPKPGDLFTTATTKSPGTSGRSHIGFVESVETDSSGKVTKVHTIEGNYNWEVTAAAYTKVSRSVWTIGQRRYGALLCEYIDIEKLFS